MTRRRSRNLKKSFEKLALENEKITNNYLTAVWLEQEKAQSKIENQIQSWYQRIAINNNVSMVEAKKLLSNKELKEFKWSLEEYIEKGRENAVNQKWIKELENASARVHIERLESQKILLQAEIEQLYNYQDKNLTEFLESQYEENYYKSIFEVQKGFEIGYDVHKLESKAISKAVMQVWAADGKNFSQRIWEDKNKIVDFLHTNLTQNVILGENSNKLVNKISKEFGVKKHVAARLAYTERAVCTEKASHKAFERIGVEKYEILAELDSATSEICKEMNGKIFPMSDFAVGVTSPPFHPNCRTTTVPYYEDINEEELTKNEENTEKLEPDTEYEDWKEEHVKVDLSERRKQRQAERVKRNGEKAKELEKIVEKAPENVKIEELKTVEEVEEALKSHGWFLKQEINGKIYDSNKTLSIKGVDLNAAKGIYTTLERLYTKYPQLKGKLASITTNRLDKGIYAQTYIGLGNGGVTLNVDKFKNSSKLEVDYANDVKKGFHTAGTDWAAIITHEMAHSVDDYLSNTLRIAGKTVQGRTKWVSHTIRNEVMKKVGFKLSDIKEQVSDYATVTPKEWFAECFAEYMHSESPRPVAVEFGKKFDELMEWLK